MVQQVSTTDVMGLQAHIHTMVCCHCGQASLPQQPDREPAHGDGAPHKLDLHVRTLCHGLAVSLPEAGLVLRTAMV